MNEKSYEERVAEYEAARNEAMEKWFSARPNIVQNRKNEYLFEAGFRMAWELKSK